MMILVSLDSSHSVFKIYRNYYIETPQPPTPILGPNCREGNEQYYKNSSVKYE